MISHRHVKQLVGQHIHCHTHFGIFKGIVVQTTKHHIILGSVPRTATPVPADWEARPFGMGPGGPMGPGPGPGGPGGSGGGPGWGIAIPLAAILGITAVGMHWW